MILLIDTILFQLNNWLCASINVDADFARIQKTNPLMSNKQNIKITHFNRNPFFFTVQTFPKRKKNQIIGLRGSVYIKIPFNVSLISQKENGTI